jgi:hypothetical protein
MHECNKFSQNKQENDESSLAERSEGKGVASTFMAPGVGQNRSNLFISITLSFAA